MLTTNPKIIFSERDSKRSQFFRMENELFGSKFPERNHLRKNNLTLVNSDKNYTEENDLIIIAGDIISTHVPKRRFENFVVSETSTCRTSNSFRPNIRTLDIERNYRNVPYLLHAIAHTLSQYTYTKPGAHGPHFVTIYMMLLNRYLDMSYKVLCDTADRYNIPYVSDTEIHRFLKFDRGFRILNKPHKESKRKLSKLLAESIV